VSRAVLLSSKAQSEYEALDPDKRARVRAALLEFAEKSRGDVKKLRGVGGGRDLYRLRVGDLRIVFALSAREVRVTRLVPRSEGYEWL
jgi:mRNA interferase RelE/StbE